MSKGASATAKNEKGNKNITIFGAQTPLPLRPHGRKEWGRGRDGSGPSRDD